MQIIHYSKFPYNFVKDGKTFSGTSYKAVLKDDKGYIVKKMTAECFNSKPLCLSEVDVFYDEFGRIVSFIKKK